MSAGWLLPLGLGGAHTLEAVSLAPGFLGGWSLNAEFFNELSRWFLSNWFIPLAVILSALVLHAIFLRVCAFLLGLGRTFGSAFMAALYHWLCVLILAFVVNLVVGSAQWPVTLAIVPVASVVVGLVAIQKSYDSGYIQAFLAYVASVFLTLLLLAGLLVILGCVALDTSLFIST